MMSYNLSSPLEALSLNTATLGLGLQHMDIGETQTFTITGPLTYGSVEFSLITTICVLSESGSGTCFLSFLCFCLLVDLACVFAVESWLWCTR